ncbi:MAG: hypothetical protein ACP5O8_03340 [Candidatus Aenigmatarchaeota archaeon]
MKKAFSWLTYEEKLKRISRSSSRVLEAIKANWPANPLEVAEFLNDKGSQKSLSAKYIYHFKKLKKAGLIMVKKVGNTYVAWPVEVEKLRLANEVLKGL